MFKQRHIPLVLATIMSAGTYSMMAVAQSPAPSKTTTEAPAKLESPAATQAATDYRSSKLVGTAVYNSANERIGDINDLIIDSKGNVAHVVIGVGGFLGMGEKNVAMPFSALKASRDSNGSIKVVVDGTKDSLKSMPDYTFYRS